MQVLKYSKAFRALSNEQRLKIFLMLYENAKNCESKKKGKNRDENCEYPGIKKAFTMVCRVLPLSKSTVSHHFKELQNANLITYERKGQYYICQINMKTLRSIRKLLE